ncbi:RAI1-domain-containing protein [Mycena sanguinolenta]|nr:RAI1-domain-containing protein [Mycena sanguinolenta]
MSKKKNLTELLDNKRASTKQRRRGGPPPPVAPAYTLAHSAAGTSLAFQQPTQIISFSYTPARELKFTPSASKGCRCGGLARSAHSADGGVARILTAPYEERDGWETASRQWDMNVMRANGVLYFEEHLTEEKLRANNLPPRQRLQTYMGYAFESYCTSATPSSSNPPCVNVPQAPGDPPGWSGDVGTNVRWGSVVRTKLGETTLVIGSEVGCVRGKYTGKTDTFVELKTSMVICNRQDEMRFEKKLLKFHMLSFLLGVPVRCAFLFHCVPILPSITTTQTFRTGEIPRLVRGKAHGWNPGRCLAWGEAVLEFLKKHKGQGNTHTHTDAAVWRVAFRPGVSVQLDDVTVRDVESGEEGGVKDRKEKVERVG